MKFVFKEAKEYHWRIADRNEFQTVGDWKNDDRTRWDFSEELLATAHYWISVNEKNGTRQEFILP